MRQGRHTNERFHLIIKETNKNVLEYLLCSGSCARYCGYSKKQQRFNYAEEFTSLSRRLMFNMSNQNL